MLARRRKFGSASHVLSDHSLDRQAADRISDRHRALGMNSRVVEHQRDGRRQWAVYRSCAPSSVRTGRRLKKIIHVNQAMIAHNRRNPKNPKPPITIQTSKGSIRASRMKIKGESEVIYQPEDPLRCGARLWIETYEPVVLDECGELV
jgi:hypothetical protein